MCKMTKKRVEIFSPLRGGKGLVLDVAYSWVYNDVKDGGNMAYSEAQKNATLKYKAKTYEKLNLDVKIGTKDKWKAQAAKQGLSLTAYITKLIEKDMEGNG